MRSLFLASLFLGAAVATLASAQSMPGGMGGGGGGRHGGGHGGHSQGGAAPPAASSAQPLPRETPTDQAEIVGVVKAIDAATGRITIAYEPVEALNWPAGTTPFVVSRTALLSAAVVGQKVRFHLESQQIADLAPF
jgi:Cu/Ag efflux protein CusF